MFTSEVVTADGRFWECGDVRLHARRTADELHIHLRLRENDDGPFPELNPLADAPTVRFAILPTSTVSFCVRAADRPMVVRPEHPLVLVPGATAEIFVSLPVWMGVAVDGIPVFERPSRAARSTWFGATPQAGELAYASRTSARVDSNSLLNDTSRAITPIRLENSPSDHWPIERLKVPTRFLPLYACSGAGGLWTPTITIRNAANDADVDVAIDRNPPAVAGVGTWVAPARETGTPRLSLRALGGLVWMS